MTSLAGFLLEAVVAGLLAATLLFCIRLDRRLKAFRLNEGDMRKTIQDLSAATERAERAVEQLQASIHECDTALADRLHAAERQSQDLARQVRAGGDIVARISRIVAAGREARTGT